MNKNASVVEGEPAGEIVTTIAKRIPGYHFVPGIESGSHIYEDYFYTNATDWTIRTRIEVDRDTMAHELRNTVAPVVFNIVFRIVDDFYDNNVTCIYLTLNVIDIDDNMPQFTVDVQPLPRPISEVIVNGRIPIPLAVDRDEGINGTTNYTLLDGLGIFQLEIRYND